MNFIIWKANMAYCPNCGKQVNTTANFCRECGYHLKSEQTEQTKLQDNKITTRCARHPQLDAVESCVECGRGVCTICKSGVQGRVYCPSCIEKLRTKNYEKTSNLTDEKSSETSNDSKIGSGNLIHDKPRIWWNKPKVYIPIGIVVLIGIVLAIVLLQSDHFPNTINVPGSSAPDIEWSKTFGVSVDDFGTSVQQTSDGGYIVVGTVDHVVLYFGNFSALYLVKTDASGNKQWSKTFGGGVMDWRGGYSVQQTYDGGYIAAGYSYSYTETIISVYLVKTDASGNEQWSTTFGEGMGKDVQQTSDGGYIVVGSTNTSGASYDIYLVKTDSSGNEQWSTTFGGNQSQFGNSVQQTSDGGYIVAGRTESSRDGDVYLVKTDSSGNEQWSKNIGGTRVDEGSSVEQTSDGGYIIAGTTNSSGAGKSHSIYLVKTDSSGNEQWSKSFGDLGDVYGSSVQQTSDGGYIVAGAESLYGGVGIFFYLVKTDASGNGQWSKGFGGPQGIGSDVQQTSDGGYIVVGVSNYDLTGNLDIYLAKIGSSSTQ